VKHIGIYHRMIDWEARTRGSLSYAGDVQLDGLLEALILRSPHPHARIRRIDTTPARALPGVHAVITAADFPAGARYMHEGAFDRPPLADAVVRFVGQEVAAVAAEMRQQAQAALRAMIVEYDPLPAPPLTTSRALSRGVSRLHERPTQEQNLSHRVVRNWGDAEAGRRNSTVCVAGDYLFPRQMHACMESNIAVARWDEAAELLEFWVSTQSPYYVATEVAHVLGLKDGQVICHEVGVGGGFGAKSKICEHEAIAGLLARLARRPVRLKLPREQEFETTKTRHAFSMSIALHADAAGRLRAIDGDIDVDNGAFNHSGVSVLSAGIKGLGMLSRPDGLQITGQLIDTALTPGGQFRGYGTVQTSFAVECLMDELADKLGIDPIDLRILNANQAGETTLVGARLGSARLVECLTAVRDAIGWNREKSQRRPGRGVGVSSGVHVSGSFTVPGANRSDAAIDVFSSGRVRVRFGGADAGTGQKTIMAQIAAEELGITVGDVDVLTMESNGTPFDMGAWSSRGTHYSGHAVHKAAVTAAERLKALAATRLGRTDLHLDGGMVKSASQAMPLGEVVQLSNELTDGVLTTQASFVEEHVVQADRDTGEGNVSASYNFAAHAAIVEVDRCSGQVKVVDYVAAHDIGLAINRTTAESQIIGGTVMGLGAALGEEVIFEQGKMVNPAYLYYALPRAADVPSIKPILIEGGDPLGPYGAKAVGECSINPPPSVISNAVYDAIGVRIRELPITPDKIIRALADREGRRRRHRIWRRPSRWWIALVRFAYPRGLLKILHGRNTQFPSHVEPAPVEKVESFTDLQSVMRAMGSDAAIFAGGTDLQLRRRQGLVQPKRLISLARVAELQEVKDTADGSIDIGAAVTLNALAKTLRHRVPMIAQAVDRIASAQIREMASVAGNLVQAKRCWFYRSGFGCYKRLGGLAPCYAIEGDHRFYHAAIDGNRCQATTPSDLATAFCAVGAEAIIVGPCGKRIVPMGDFYTGPGETVLAPDEILQAITIPAEAVTRTGAFVKLGLWEGDFAIASVAMTARVDSDGALHLPRIVMGGLAPVPWRASSTERQIDGQRVGAATFRHILDGELDRAAHPLPRNGWKLDAAAGLAEQALKAIVDAGVCVGTPLTASA
jgi:CO/xanthine dehydrogenase Mo-binding subunit/CO/xanthine dehydrogenase FAD-binding subunit